MFWRPDLYAQTVILAPSGSAFTAAKTFQPDRWSGDLVSRDGPGGRHLLLRARGETYQVLVDRALREGAPMAVLAPADGAFDVRYDAAARLLRTLAGRPMRAPARPRDHRLRRYRLALGAFDDWRAGASYRDTAVRLYGGGRVAAEAWRTSVLRDTVIRLTRLGRTLVAGGYRSLLSRGPG